MEDIQPQSCQIIKWVIIRDEISWNINNFAAYKSSASNESFPSFKQNYEQGMLQGGDIPPVFWLMVIGEILQILYRSGVNVVEYANELLIFM